MNVCAYVALLVQALGSATVTYYHAGIESSEQRRLNQEAWSQNKAQVICATVAFGMGINKPDVRYVIHNSMPKSLTHYYQVRACDYFVCRCVGLPRVGGDCILTIDCAGVGPRWSRRSARQVHHVLFVCGQGNAGNHDS